MEKSTQPKESRGKPTSKDQLSNFNKKLKKALNFNVKK